MSKKKKNGKQVSKNSIKIKSLAFLYIFNVVSLVKQHSFDSSVLLHSVRIQKHIPHVMDQSLKK